jgi:tRNA-specific 2-thiouridylase
MTSGKKSSKGAPSRVAVAMSGGVDSSLAAALVRKDGFDTVGVTFRMWPKEECGTSYGRACCSLEAITRARAAAEKIGIPYYVYDLSGEFRREVIDYFCSAYLAGTTPNPCVVCNERIKFAALWDKARRLGATHIATGHYARTGFDKRRGRFLLRRGADSEKDQSYFLFPLDQAQLSRAIFPLGGMTKARTRALAKKLHIPSYNAVSSQDVCFISGLGYADYIKKKSGVVMEPGDIVDLSGKVLGRHKGVIFYTIGQRRGLGISHSAPLYVVGIDVKANRIIVGAKKDVLKSSLIAERLNWIEVEDIDKPMRVTAKIRYNHKMAKAIVTRADKDSVRVDFDEPQEAPTPGQAVVFYDKDIVIGGGWIT